MKTAVEVRGRHSHFRIKLDKQEDNSLIIEIYATRVLQATGKVGAAKVLLEMALIAFYTGKVASARFYVKNTMPDLAAFLELELAKMFTSPTGQDFYKYY